MYICMYLLKCAIKIAEYGMNGPKFQLDLFNDTIVITASILAHAFQ